MSLPVFEIVIDSESHSPAAESSRRIVLTEETDESLKKFCSVRALSDIDRPLNDYRLFNTKESVALYNAHVKAWKEIVEKGIKHAVVLDKTCEKTEGEENNGKNAQNLPFMDGDVFLFDYNVMPETMVEKTSNPEWKRLKNIFHGFNGYIITNQGARFLLRFAYPIEMRIDSLVGTLANLYPDEFKVYARSRSRSEKKRREERIVHLSTSKFETPFLHNHPRHTRPSNPLSNVPMLLMTMLVFGIFLAVVFLIANMVSKNDRKEEDLD
jgi:hypothetical protein